MTLLQFCVEFTSANIFIIDIIEVTTPVVSTKRQLSLSTTSQIVLAALVPAEIPVVTDGEVPIVPADTLAEAVRDNINIFQTMTGLTVNGNPTVFFVPVPRPPIDFDDIAVIVLPIVVTVLVLALVGGVAIVLIVV